MSIYLCVFARPLHSTSRFAKIVLSKCVRHMVDKLNSKWYQTDASGYIAGVRHNNVQHQSCNCKGDNIREWYPICWWQKHAWVNERGRTGGLMTEQWWQRRLDDSSVQRFLHCSADWKQSLGKSLATSSWQHMKEIPAHSRIVMDCVAMTFVCARVASLLNEWSYTGWLWPKTSPGPVPLSSAASMFT